jgi:uncharacterized protein (UPF0335 family)
MGKLVYRLKADIEPLEAKIEQVLRLEQEMNEVMSGLIEAMQELEDIRIPIKLEMADDAGDVSEYEGL